MRRLWSAAVLASVCLALPVRADESTKASTASVEVPYTMTKFQHVVVRAKINGKGPYNFILDTGAPAMFIARDVGKKIGLKPDRTNWAELDKLELEGGLVVPKAGAIVDTPFQLEGMNGLGLGGVEIHGVIGYDIVARYKMEIDFTKDKMTWTPSGAKLVDMKRIAGGRGAGGGLEMLGSIMKLMGGMLGSKANPDIATRGYIGIELDGSGTALKIKTVQENSPAALAGVKSGDKLSKFQGKTVFNSEDVLKLAKKVTSGQTVKLTVVRGDETKEITVKTREGL